MILINGAIYRVNNFNTYLAKDNNDGSYDLMEVILYGQNRHKLTGQCVRGYTPSGDYVGNIFSLVALNPVNVDKPKIKLLSVKRVK